MKPYPEVINIKTAERAGARTEQRHSKFKIRTHLTNTTVQTINNQELQ
jgi:hypothetical protein